MPDIPGKGLIKGLGVTFGEMVKTAQARQHGRRAGHGRRTRTSRKTPSRGRAASSRCYEENCTSCMLCARECPDWCIYIEGHKYLAPPRREGGKPRQKNALDRFDIDFSLCMYCGICVEVCPFDALFWSPEYEYSEPQIAELLHDKSRLGRVDGDGARLRGLRSRLRGEGQEGAGLMLAEPLGGREHRLRPDRRSS